VPREKIRGILAVVRALIPVALPKNAADARILLGRVVHRLLRDAVDRGLVEPAKGLEDNDCRLNSVQDSDYGWWRIV
jgi:hypothetical protein